MKLTNLLIINFLLSFNVCCNSQTRTEKIVVGAEQPELYLSKIKNKTVGLMVNQSSMVDTVHLLDFMILNNIAVKKIFAIEHGFRGEAANGEEFNNSIDNKTKLPIVSLYGKNKKPTTADLHGIDILIFDIQDVGCRFFTYISSMHYAMEACAENNIEFLILDRPNPNGDYIDGPVLNMDLKSFVGMHPIPIVHGCTVGELAQMINGEGWLANNVMCKIDVIPVKNYKHSDPYCLPVKPSPNLPTNLSIRLYPSLCLFEATNVSIGRGTYFPFQVIGYPNCTLGNFKFTPITIPGMSNEPLFENEECHGIDLRNLKNNPKFTLEYFLMFAGAFENYDNFWKSKRWIDLLTGDKEFYTQVNNGISEAEIKNTWQEKIIKYKKIRKKYLLYTDFE